MAKELGPLRFSDMAGYKKSMAYIHIHNLAKHKRKVFIAGKPHKVIHSKKG